MQLTVKDSKGYVLTKLQEIAGIISTMSNDHALLDDLLAAAQACSSCLKQGGKILLAGNGGSAADAQHIAGELVGTFTDKERSALPALALNANTSVLTALANDYGYEKVFSRQISAYGNSGDIFIAYSTSGKSANILQALQVAKDNGLICIGFTGREAPLMGSWCDYLLKIPATDTPKIQEGHTILGHILCGLIEAELFNPIVNYTIDNIPQGFTELSSPSPILNSLITTPSEF